MVRNIKGVLYVSAHDLAGVSLNPDQVELRLYFFMAGLIIHCLANAIEMGQTTWAIWAVIKKYSLRVSSPSVKIRLEQNYKIQYNLFYRQIFTEFHSVKDKNTSAVSGMPVSDTAWHSAGNGAMYTAAGEWHSSTHCIPQNKLCCTM